MFTGNGKSELCKWAQIWRSFRFNPAYGWRTCYYKTLEMERVTLYSANALDGEAIVFVSGSILTLRKASLLGKSKYTIRLPIASDTNSNVPGDRK